MVVRLSKRDSAVSAIDRNRPRFIASISSSSLSTSIINFMATELMPAYKPVRKDSAKSKRSKSLLSVYYFSSRYCILASFVVRSFVASVIEAVE